jgi:hypothetical protein
MHSKRQGLDVEKAEAAFKRAAHKALHGTREERSGRFMTADDRGEARRDARGKSSTTKLTKSKA